MRLIILVASLLHHLRVIYALSDHPIIVMVALDGFRADYLRRGHTPTLQRFAAEGSTAEYMLSQFPSVTLPNFHSMSTGMYPETHGLLGNFCFNEKRECLESGYEISHYNEEIIPIWNLNELSGDKRYSGIIEWPASEYAYQKIVPTHRLYADHPGYKIVIDTVFRWITNDTHPANFILVYFDQPDDTGHEYGPQSSQLDETLREIDRGVEYYLRQLDERGLRDRVNTIVVSDHGMTAINTNDLLRLDDYIEPGTYTKCGGSPEFEIQPKKGYEDTVYENLSKGARSSNKFDVYKKNDIPDAYRMKNTRRLGDLLVVCKLHYIFADGTEKSKGCHGYDPNLEDMHALFIANGPLFKRNYVTKPFQNIDIYPLIRHLLKLESPPKHVTPNGTLAYIIDIVKG